MWQQDIYRFLQVSMELHLGRFVVHVLWNCYAFRLVRCTLKCRRHALIHHHAWQPLCIPFSGGCQRADTNPNAHLP